MMKKRYILGILPLAAVLLAGCTAADDMSPQPVPPVADGDAVPVSLTMATAGEWGDGDGGKAGTRTTNTGLLATQFSSGDAFYAYFPSGVTVGSTTSASSTTFTHDASGNVNPAAQPYMNPGVSSATVHAYYPSGHRQTTASFSVLADQTRDENYKASDLMYATATLTKTAASTVTGALTFTHRMAKIIVTATADTNKGVTAVTKVCLLNCCRTATFSTPLSCTMNTSSGFSNKEAITLYNNTTGAASVSCAGLIPPQTISNQQFLEVTVKTAGGLTGTATYSLTKTFAGANAYTYRITVNLAAVGTTTAITAWGNGGTTTLVNNGTTTLTTQ